MMVLTALALLLCAICVLCWIDGRMMKIRDSARKANVKDTGG